MRIEIKDLSKSYGKVRALSGISLAIEPGQIVAVLGPNGAGKTTLLRCLATIAAVDRGSILCDEEELRRDRIDLRQRLFFLPDFPLFYPEMKLVRHIGMVLRVYRADAPEAPARVLELLRDFDLLPLIDSGMGTLSRGQAYKAALCACLAVDPELWLLDEPFASGMDPHGLMSFKNRARDAAARGHTVLYSTQILDVAEGFSDKVCVIHKSELRAFESVAQLAEKKGTPGNVLESLFETLR
ncbi:MAG: ABC transporter ATP-binding protein [Planctomycetota bacterium]|nr:ABC transporter ATP-binding protein [Planctomycetota bacterium]